MIDRNTGAMWAYSDYTAERDRTAVARAIFEVAQKGTHWMFLFDREATQKNEDVALFVRELCLFVAASLDGGLIFLETSHLDSTDNRHVLVMAIPKKHMTPDIFAAVARAMNSDNRQPADFNDVLIVFDPDHKSRYPDMRRSPVYKLAMGMITGTFKIPYTGPHLPSVN